MNIEANEGNKHPWIGENKTKGTNSLEQEETCSLKQKNRIVG
jgi:hypothetical protein